MDFYPAGVLPQARTPTVRTTRTQLGEDFPRIAETVLKTSDDGRFVLASVKNGDGGEAEHFLRKPDGAWIAGHALLRRRGRGGLLGRRRPLPALAQGCAAREDPARPPRRPRALQKATVVVAPRATRPSRSSSSRPAGCTCTTSSAAPRRCASSIWPRTSRPAMLPVPPGLGRDRPREARRGQHRLQRRELHRAGRLVQLRPGHRQGRPDQHGDDLARRLLGLRGGARDGDLQGRHQGPALRSCGARAPSSTARIPTLLYGYGGFGASITPLLRRERARVARAGRRHRGREPPRRRRVRRDVAPGRACCTHKQNVFDDFAACAQRLIEAGYTKPGELAIEGGSNGGLLMGAMITQHPELFRAVVAHVGHLRHAPLRALPQRAVQRHRVRLGVQDQDAVRGALRVLALPPRRGRHDVPRGASSSPAPTTRAWTRANSRKMVARLQAATRLGPAGAAAHQRRHRAHRHAARRAHRLSGATCTRSCSTSLACCTHRRRSSSPARKEASP